MPIHAGRRVAVLGGAGGIGRALVSRLVASGARVAVLDLPASLARHEPPGQAIAVEADISDASSVARAAAELTRSFGALDGFVNLAGFVSPNQPLAETADAAFDEVMAGNLRGAFLAAKAVLPLLAVGDRPSFVNVASGLAANVRPGYGPYAMAKAGMIAMTKTLALEAAPKVRVNAVAPGAVDTAFLRGGTGRSDESGPVSLNVEAYAQAIPLQRIATPEDVVGPILFLLSADSGYMTGQVLWINGGAYMP